MRIRRLGIVNTLHFPSFELQFEGNCGGLHVVHGPNEAGKSTILRAWLDLLFGGRIDDDFDGYSGKSQIYGAFVADDAPAYSLPATPEVQLDPLGILSLAASSKSSNSVTRSGNHREHEPSREATPELLFTRGRKTKRLVLLRDGGSIVDEDALQALLGGLDRDRYRLLFGFNHDRLREGGDSLLQSGGHAGISLFEAGGAMQSLQPALRTLTDRAQAILDPGFRSNSGKLLNAAYREHKTLLENARKNSLRGDEWHRLKTDIEEARNELDELKRQRALSREDEVRLARVDRVRKFESQLHEARAVLASFANATELDVELETRILEQLSRHDELDRDLRAERSERDLLRERIRKIVIDERILAADHSIQALQEQMAHYGKARDSLPRLASERSVREQQMKKIHQHLNPNSAHSVDEVDALRVPLTVDREIRDLAKEWSNLGRDEETRRQQMDEYQAERKKLTMVQDDVKTPPFLSEIRDVLAELGRHGDVDHTLKSMTRAILSKQQGANTRLASQSIFEGTPSELRMLPIPLWETISRFVEESQEHEFAIRDVESKIQHHRVELSQIRDQLESMERFGHVPVDEDLDLARKVRDQGWALVKHAWLGEPQTVDDIPAYASDGPLYLQYEKAVTKSDEVADVMRNEAGRSAERRTLLLREKWLESAIEGLRTELDSAKAEYAKCERRWMNEWAQSGITPKSPAEMKAWHANVYQPVMEHLVQLDTAQEEYEALVLQRDEWVSRMKRIAARLQGENLAQGISGAEAMAIAPGFEEPAEEAGQTLRQLATMLGSVITDADKSVARREELRRQQEQLETRLAQAQRQHASITEKMEKVRAEWDGIRAHHPHLPQKVNIAVDYLDELRDLFDAAQEASRLASDWEAQQQVCANFEAQVTKLAHSLDRPLPASESVLPWIRSAIELQRQAQSDDSARRSLAEDLNRRDERLDRIAREVDDNQNEIHGWMDTYACTDVQSLRSLVIVSGEKRQAKVALAKIEADFQKAGDGLPIDKLLEELATAPTGAEFTLRQEEVLEALASLDKQIADLLGTLGAMQAKFEAMDGSSGEAADWLQQAEFALTKVDKYWNEYLRLELARRLLERAIDNFREQNESSVIARASEIFRRLTLERYVELTVEYDGETPILEAVMSDKTQRRVTQLSDGTRDQLYLSLRLAFVEQHAASGLTVPLVMDDILVHFDDARSFATLEVLRDLAGKTQILYFTHHESIAAAASQLVDTSGALVHVHRIGSAN